MGKIRSGELRGPVSLVNNLKLVVNASVNKLDIFSRSGGAVPDASNPISVAIPDGNGNVMRSRGAAYLSGTSQFIMADGANYWSKGSLDAEIKTAYVYAIWDGTGIIWALAGYSGFTRVPASTTATDDDFFLLEEGSTYTKAVTEYCVCVGKIRYQYDTADTPDHTIQATVLDAPQVVWNPKSDYEKTIPFSTTVVAAGGIAEYSAVSAVVKQSGRYFIQGNINVTASASLDTSAYLKVGSSTYASATYLVKSNWYINGITDPYVGVPAFANVYLNAGDTIHLGARVGGGAGNECLFGDDTAAHTGATKLRFQRID